LQVEYGIRARNVTGVQTCALPICGTAGAGPGPGHGAGSTELPAGPGAVRRVRPWGDAPPAAALSAHARGRRGCEHLDPDGLLRRTGERRVGGTVQPGPAP